MAILINEVVEGYSFLPNMTEKESEKICNTLHVLKKAASTVEGRKGFLQGELEVLPPLHRSNTILPGHYSILLYPFLRTTQKGRAYEQLRLGCLGVVDTLLQHHDAIEPLTGPNDGTRMISFFLTTELVPLCLRVMEHGIEASKTTATATLLKILLDETGLTYICHTQERQEAVMRPLAVLVEDVVQKQSIRLLKLVLQCYTRLTDDRG